nr:hypothetical protein [Tanacetum cinerariifolium]
MILKTVEHSLLIWPTIEENGVNRTKKYVELSTTEKIQADYDMKEINIILQGLPTDIYSLVNHHRVAKDLWEKVQLQMQVKVKTADVKCCCCRLKIHLIGRFRLIKEHWIRHGLF